MSENIGKLLENKQLIHIASEVVVMLGMAVYFSSKNRRLQSYIEQLTKKFEEQEERLQKIEKYLSQMSQRFQLQQEAIMQMTQKPMVPNPTPVPAPVPTPNSTSTKKKGLKKPSIEEITPIKVEGDKKEEKVVKFQKEEELDISAEEIEEDSDDLDLEIQQELEERFEGQSNLKKQP